jgi:hypothetical protein
MRVVLSIAALYLVASCTPSTQVTQGSSSVATAINHEAPYLWSGKTTFPLTLSIDSKFNSNEVTSIKDMATAWKSSVENKKTFYSFSSSLTTKSFNIDSPDSEMGIYKATTWPSDVSESALAITQIFGRRHNVGEANEYVSIEHADILVNYAPNTYGDIFPFDSKDNDVNEGYDLRTVVLHEMGHFLGLQHIPTIDHKVGADRELSDKQYKASSVMYPSISEIDVKRIPKTRDINEIVKKYGLSTTAGAVSLAASTFKPNNGDSGKSVKIVIELRADGECVHKEDGVIHRRHHLKIK